MTKHELSKLIYLNRETEYLKSKIEELECVAESSQLRITGMSRTLNFLGRVGSYAAEIAELKELLGENFGKCFRELNRIKGFINDIEDS